jgi:hypothetical protein
MQESFSFKHGRDLIWRSEESQDCSWSNSPKRIEKAILLLREIKMNDLTYVLHPVTDDPLLAS